MRDPDKASKIKGLAWVLAGVFVACAFGFGLSPFVRLIPWSWEKKISHLGGFNASGAEVCDGSLKNQALLKKLVTRLYPLDREDDRFSVEVQIVKDPSVNAFAQLGGKISVNSALLEKAESAEEIAGVLAHEIQHVSRRHILEGFIVHLMTVEGIKAVFSSGGSMANSRWADYFLHMGFSRSQETEADHGGLLRLQKAHIDNQGFKKFFERMKESSVVPALLSDHPADQNRSQMAEEFKNENTTAVMTAEEWKSFQAYCR